MAYRTFFLVGRDIWNAAPPGIIVTQAVTYVDVSEGVVVEQVAARMSGDALKMSDMQALFPEAMAAAAGYSLMHKVARSDSGARGPYCIQTDYPPDIGELVQWFIDTYHTFDAAPPVPQRRPAWSPPGPFLADVAASLATTQLRRRTK